MIVSPKKKGATQKVMMIVKQLRVLTMVCGAKPRLTAVMSWPEMNTQRPISHSGFWKKDGQHPQHPLFLSFVS